MKAKFTQMFIYRNLPNIVSILGILPLAILFFDGGFYFLVPLIIYDNIMDDLDGILARKLNLKSDFGAILDDVCDGFATHGIEAVLHYSRRSARAFLDAARDEGVEISALAIPQCCLSETVASVLR
ncbi:MAG: CDP-alcohol phosphatidyltransferase family protein, partial [Candidatus Lindowbacteria bacterium]|nr:CDP-alcohol phosphatidyltransferase family protein [Candidatus Lindowbacteria bacterium]